jgi:hypothetical protein
MRSSTMPAPSAFAFQTCADAASMPLAVMIAQMRLSMIGFRNPAFQPFAIWRTGIPALAKAFI